MTTRPLPPLPKELVHAAARGGWGSIERAKKVVARLEAEKREEAARTRVRVQKKETCSGVFDTKHWLEKRGRVRGGGGGGGGGGGCSDDDL